LLDQVRQAIRTRHYSYRTEKAYVHWIKRFVFFHNKRHPIELGEPEIAQFLSSLASDSHVSASTQNQALNALLFLYKEVLGKKIGLIQGVVRANRPKRLPIVLTFEEVKRILDCLQSTPWLMAVLLYGAGLRLLECCHLRIKDIDFSCNQIVVRAGKGNKDRYTVLLMAVVQPLRKHLQAVKRQHEEDLIRGLGRVALPDALERKYPNAGKEWGWQWVFPAQSFGSDSLNALNRSTFLWWKRSWITCKEKGSLRPLHETIALPPCTHFSDMFSPKSPIACFSAKKSSPFPSGDTPVRRLGIFSKRTWLRFSRRRT
jgi:integron integrase